MLRVRKSSKLIKSKLFTDLVLELDKIVAFLNLDHCYFFEFIKESWKFINFALKFHYWVKASSFQFCGSVVYRPSLSRYRVLTTKIFEYFGGDLALKRVNGSERGKNI